MFFSLQLTQDEKGANFLTTYSSKGAKLPNEVHPLFYKQSKGHEVLIKF